MDDDVEMMDPDIEVVKIIENNQINNKKDQMTELVANPQE